MIFKVTNIQNIFNFYNQNKINIDNHFNTLFQQSGYDNKNSYKQYVLSELELNEEYADFDEYLYSVLYLMQFLELE